MKLAMRLRTHQARVNLVATEIPAAQVTPTGPMVMVAVGADGRTTSPHFE